MSESMISVPLLTHSPLLREMLTRVRTVDFHERMNQDPVLDEKKLTDNAIVVIVIEELLSLASDNDWGLCKMNGYVYAYNGQYWQLVDPDDFKSFLGDAACLMGIRRVAARHFSFQNHLYSQFKASARLEVVEKSKEITLINLQNGTYEVTAEGGRLREFRQEDGLTYQLPFEYNEDADCPIFRAYLNRVLPDEDLQNILAEFMAYIFAKHLKLEKCLLLYGNGANGKSVFFEIINALLGKENVSNFSLGNLAEEHNRALIADKLLNYGSEIKGGINSDTFKQLASNEPIQCRRKYENSIIIRDYARLCFNCNELPKDVEHTEAYFRRFLIVPFTVTIPEEERDPDLAKEIILNELSGIFNWVLEGLHRLLFHKNFTKSEAVKQVVSDYKKQSDSVLLFLEEHNFQPSSSAYIQGNVVHSMYRDFCTKDGYKFIGRSLFNKRLLDLGYQVGRKSSGMVVYLQHQKYSEQESV